MLYIAVALTTLATLLLELSLTRIFAVVFQYQFAFLAIPVALFGLGAGGICSCVVSEWGGSLFRKLGVVSLVDAGLVLAAILFLLTRSADLTAPERGLIYFLTALPFFGAGVILSLVTAATIERVGKICFFGLTGAAGGCLLLIVLLNTFGGPNTVIAVAVMLSAAAAIWFGLAGVKEGRIASVFAALFLTMLIIVNTKYHFVDVRYARGQKIQAELYNRWNSISRVGLTKDAAGSTIHIDADASSAIADFDFNHLTPANINDLLHEGPGLAYEIRPAARTLIIGPGGGGDVARALASGSRDVTGVETNPIIASTIMEKRFPQLSRGLYRRPDVHIQVEDGRSFIRRSNQKYQIIQVALADLRASREAGAFGLSGNILYTTDGFVDCLSHLTDDGLLVFTQWSFDPARESLRVVAVAMAALAQMGESDFARHVLAAREGEKDTVIIARRPFSEADLVKARIAFEAAKMTPLWAPGDVPKNEFGQLLLTNDPVAWERNYPLDITPVGDNRPFFFFAGSGSQTFFEALAVSFAAVLAILLLPPLLLGSKLSQERTGYGFLLYFLAIGAGYVLVAAALIQKFALFLGHPTYASTIVIFSMLISSAAGGFFSQRIVAGSNGRLMAVLAAGGTLAALLALAAEPALAALMSLPPALKMLATVLIIGPAGFAMGIPFPAGLRILDARNRPWVRWAWSISAVASVFGSVGALLLALYSGLVQTMLAGGGLYLGALLVLVVSPAARRPVTRRARAAVSV